MAFFENIDDIVQKIKDGTITGAAAVAAISGAFKNFGLTIPATAQAIAASGNNTIGSLFTKIIQAVNAYRNKLLQVKALESTLGDDMDDPPPTKEEITYMEQVKEAERKRRTGGAISRFRTTAIDSIGAVFNTMLREAQYGKDGKPISDLLRNKRAKEYHVEAKKLTDSLPKIGDDSEAGIARMTNAWIVWSKWLYSVDMVGAVKKARGGPVKKGSTYLTGELGPELVTMGGSGEVISNF